MGIEKIAATENNILKSLSDAVVTFESARTLTVDNTGINIDEESVTITYSVNNTKEKLRVTMIGVDRANKDRKVTLTINGTFKFTVTDSDGDRIVYGETLNTQYAGTLKVRSS